MDFKEKVNQWKQLFQTDRQQADTYYYGNIFEEVIEHFLSKSKALRRYRFLISLLGYSPQPIILFVKAIQPEKVLFIHSEESELCLDVIQRWTDLRLSQVIPQKVDSSDPTVVYKAIKDFVISRNPKEVLLDITGGKKAMVGGAAMAGNMLGVDTGYVDYANYLPDLRQPEPGTEYPNILKNPFYVLGDLDLEKAREAFNRCDFARSLGILSELDWRVENIREIRELTELTNIYQKMDSFDFKTAQEMMGKFLERWPGEKRFASEEKVRQSMDLLNKLTDEKHSDHHLLACLNYYFAGNRYAERKRFDIAVFLIYRTIEMVLSGGLKEAGIDPSRPIYPPWVTVERFNEKLRDVFESDYFEKVLPRKVGLMDSAIFLSIKEDPLVNDLNLKELKGVITLRNESHFTHGDRTLKEEDFRKIARLGRKLLEKYLSLKRKPILKEFEEMFSFPKV